MSSRRRNIVVGIVTLAAALAVPAARVRAQGIALAGVGAVNRSMGGAATAAPLDAIGAIHWNPATVSALPCSELAIGFEALLAEERLASRVEPGALGQGIPPIPLEGSTLGEPGVSAIPNVGLTYRADGSCFTWGLGLLAVAGFTSSYPASTTNPALMPQPPVGVGLGRLEGRAEILQLVPTVACQLTPRLHVGFAPTLTMARLAASPAVLAPPDDANGDGFPTYGSGSGTRYHWGGGFQVGAYYETDAGLNFGISFKSPQWMETFRVHGEDELGLPRLLEFDLDYPLIVTFGTSYSWCPEWLVACDVRFFNYAATDGFGPEGFGPDGALQGLGWNDIWSVHLAAQRIVNDRLTLRVAYSYNDTPITSETAFYNAISPLITQHIISAGASINVTCCFAIHLTYAYGVENSVSGPWVHPQMGPLDGTSLESTISAHALDIGASVRF